MDNSDETLREQEMEADDQVSRIGQCIACLHSRVLDHDQLCHSCGDTDARAELLDLLRTK
jgi:hypothetical protein